MEPKHVAVALERDASVWALQNKQNPQSAYAKRSDIVQEIIAAQVEMNIPLLTIFLLDNEQELDDIVLQSLIDLFEDLLHSNILKKQLKISVLGKWYTLPSRLVDIIKALLEETREYDKFFVNFCIRYDGQEEIVDACRLIGRRIKAEKLDPDAITKGQVKEDIYSSYFIAPDLLVINGPKKLNGFMLWDSAQALIYFTGKHWPEFSSRDLKKAVDLFQLVG